MKNTPHSTQALFQLNGIPPIGISLSMALQHLVAMIVGCVTPAIIIANVVGPAPGGACSLIQASLVMSAVTTLLELFPIGGKFGAGLPVMFGVSFAYLPSMQSIAAGGGGIASIAGAMIVGGVIAMIVGIFVKKIRKLFPPVITGTVVFTIGLSLYPTAIHYMAGGSGNTYDLVVAQKGLSEALVYGSWQNWAVAIFTLIVVMLLSNHGKGICKLASILLGMAAGYAVAAVMGMVDLSEISNAKWFSLPRFLHFGITFEPSACIALGLLFAINSIQAIGDLTATTIGGLNREPTDRELQGGIIAYGATQYPHCPLRRPAHGDIFPERRHRYDEQGHQPNGLCSGRWLPAAGRRRAEILRDPDDDPPVRAGRRDRHGFLYHRHDRHEAHRV